MSKSPHVTELYRVSLCEVRVGFSKHVVEFSQLYFLRQINQLLWE